MTEKKFPVAVFDLDGTLLDSIADISQCANEALALHGLPGHTMEEYKTFVGWGAENLMRKAMLPAEGDELYREVRAGYDRIYLERCRSGGRLFPGAGELLESLRARGVLTAVVSNKPQEQTEAVCKSVFGELLSGCAGQRPGVPIKPDPAGVLLLLEQLSGFPLAYVGDSDVDIATGRALGCLTIGVSWGMQPRERLTAAGAAVIADSMEELARLLAEQADNFAGNP